MRSTMEWLLAGALAASLAWNGWGALRATRTASHAEVACAEDAAGSRSSAPCCGPSEPEARSRACRGGSSDGGACAGAATGEHRPTACAPEGLERLGLDAAQRAALERVATSACAGSDRLERDADALERELFERLAAEELDTERLRALVAEVAALRRRSLEACVDGIVELRRTLSRAQVEVLVAGCSGAGGG